MTDEERLADIVSRVNMGLGDGRGDGADTMWLISKVRELEAAALTASEAMQIIVRLENGPNAFIPDKGVREKLDRIAHPEPPGL